MKISKSIESPVGTVQFVGELEGVELDMVIQLGLLSLMARGAIKTETIPEQGERH